MRTTDHNYTTKQFGMDLPPARCSTLEFNKHIALFGKLAGDPTPIMKGIS
jgi:hypothetical protein